MKRLIKFATTNYVGYCWLGLSLFVIMEAPQVIIAWKLMQTSAKRPFNLDHRNEQFNFSMFFKDMPPGKLSSEVQFLYAGPFLYADY